MVIATASLAAFTLVSSLFAAPPKVASEPAGDPGVDADTPDLDPILEDDRERAKQAFDEGLAAVAAGDFDVAVGAFERAFGLRPHPVTLFNLALALEKAERLPEAWELFDDVIDLVESNAERREVRRHMREIESEIAIVEIDATPRSRLCIDGLDMPKGEISDYRLALEPGPHELTFDEQAFLVDFDAGDRRVLLLEDAGELVGGRHQGVLMPAMLGTSIGAGTLALTLGISAAASKDPSTRTGLAAGAATTAGIAVVASIVALLIETRTLPEPTPRVDDGSDVCPGSPDLEQRLDLRIGPTLGRPVEFAAVPPATMPVPTIAAFPHPHGLQPPRKRVEETD